MEYRKRVLDSDDQEEMRDLPEEEQRLTRGSEVFRRYIPSQPVVIRHVVKERDVIICARLGVQAGLSTGANS